MKQGAKKRKQTKPKTTVKQNTENQLVPSMVAKKYVDAEIALRPKYCKTT